LTILPKGLAHTASLWPLVRAADDWLKRAAEGLNNTQKLNRDGVKRRFRALLGAMARHQHRRAPALAAMLAHFRKVTRSDWPGLFHCDHLPGLPRTHNDLEQGFGSHRYHERRATGRKGASPALVLRGAVTMTACAATRLRLFKGDDLVPINLQEWQTLRHKLESRRQQRVHRYRFRRNPNAYLAALEKDLLQRSLPP
jgi:hypothetical protein